MSTTIDEKVVEMRFDNRQFESNVKTSMSTLDKLKSSLNLTGAAKGLENISSTANKIDMSVLGNGVETVKAKFSALEVMAVTTLANITNSAVNAGKRLVSAFTIDPIKTGLNEYETQINAVQTILANTQSKGTTLDQVNDALDELNHYADMTIYNFTEMTRNIGTFTAAGVDLDTSVSAIKGIANLAAVSGSTSNQASTAMYQLSQALAAGQVKLQDWNSVVNAGMGGQVFQDALKETARVHGIAIDDMIKKEGSFRETLQNGWLSSEILTETLAKFTGDLTEEQLKSMGYTDKQIAEIQKLGKTANDAATKVKTFTQLMDTLKEAAQSGWTQTWEILIGDFEEAKELWTSVSDVFSEIINSSAEARNNMLQGWADLGGREDLLESFKNIFEAIVSVVKPIKEAFREIFPPITSKQLFALTEGLKNFTEKLILGDKASANLKSTFKGLFAVLDIVKQLFVAILKPVLSLFSGLDDLGGGILSVTGSIGDWLVKLDEAIKKTDIFNKCVQGIVGVVKFVANAIKSFISVIKERFELTSFEALQNLLGRVKERMSSLSGVADTMKAGIVKALDAIGSAFDNCDFFKLLETLWGLIKKVGSGLAKVLGALTGGLIDKLGNANFDGFFDFVNSLLLGGIGVAIAKFVKGFSDITKSVSSFKDSAIGILDEVKGCFEAYQTQLKAGTLMKIATAIAILVGAILVLSFIDSDKLSQAIGAITMLFGELVGSMALFTKFGGDFKGVTKACTAMISISLSVLILAAALKKISDLSWEELGKGLVGVTVMLGEVVGAAILLSKFGGKIKGVGVPMILIAAALKILASVCKDMSELGWEDLAKGVVGIGAILLEFVGFQALLKLIKPKKMLSSALSLVLIGAAMEIFADVCKKFGSLDWGDLAKAGAAIGGILILASGFAKLAGMAKKMMRSSVALVIIGAAMEIFADVCDKFGAIKWEALAKTGAAMTGILGLSAGFAKLAGMSNKMLGSVVSLTIIAAAMEIFADVCNKFGSMDWESLGKAGAAIGGILALAAGFAYLAGLSDGIIGSSVALLIMAAALAVFAPTLKTLGGMKWSAIAKGLIAIAAAFTILGIAGAILGPLVPSILGLAAAFALIGVGVLALGAGLTLAAVGITALATALSAGATAIAAGLTVLTVAIADCIIILIEKLGDAIVAFCNAIIEAAPAIGEAIKVLILELISVIDECAMPLVNCILKLADQLLASLVEYAPPIIDKLMSFLILVIEGIANRMPELIGAAMDLIGSFFQGIVQALGSMDSGALTEMIVGAGLLATLMYALSSLATIAPGAMAGVLAMGAVIAELTGVVAAIGAIAQIPGLDWLINEGGNLLQDLGTAIGKFIGGIVGGIAEGITASLPQIGSDISAFMTNAEGFIEGAKNVDSSVIEGAGILAGAVIALGVAEFIEGIASIMSLGSSLGDLGTDLSNFMANCAGFIEGAKGIDPTAMEGVKTLADALLVLTAANLVDQITSFISGSHSLADFGEQLAPFGEGLKAFGDSVQGVDTEAIRNAADAAQALVSVANALPGEDGWLQKICGEKSVASFGDKLPDFGDGLKKFAESVKDIDTESIRGAADAAQALVDVANTLPKEDGVWQSLVGEKSIANFGDELELFGDSINRFSSSVEGLNVEPMKTASNAAQALVDLANKLPKEDGVWQSLIGEKSLGNFGDELESFGTSLHGYSNSITTGTGINGEAIDTSIKAAKSLVKLAEWLDDHDYDEVKDFPDALITLGTSLNAYSSEVKEVNQYTIEGSVNSIKKVANMIKYLNGIDYSNVNVLPENLTDLGKKLKAFSMSVAGIDANQATASVTALRQILHALADMKNTDFSVIETFNSSLKKISKSSVDNFINAFKGANVKTVNAAKGMIDNLVRGFTLNSGKVKTASSKAVQDAIKGIESKQSAFATAGTKLMSNLAKGISQKTGSVTTAVRTAVSSACSAISSQYTVFYNQGTYLGAGLVLGINSKQQAAYDAGYALGQKAAQGEKDGQKSNSPSKLTIQYGKWLGEGLVIGIEKMGKSVYSAGYNMGETATNTISKAVSRISDMMDTSIDSQPTIRPVVDLSNVQSSADTINGMFGINPSIGLLSNVGAIDSMMNASLQNGANDDVVSAIDKLNKNLENVGGNSYVIDGITYDDGSNITDAVQSLVRAARVERRV